MVLSGWGNEGCLLTRLVLAYRGFLPLPTMSILLLPQSRKVLSKSLLFPNLYVLSIIVYKSCGEEVVSLVSFYQ